MDHKRILALFTLSVLMFIAGRGIAQEGTFIGAGLSEHNFAGTQIRLAEQHIFRLFNANNNDDSFHIRCQSRKLTGSQIPRRICAPAFIRQAGRQNTQLYANEFHILRHQVVWSETDEAEMRRFWMNFTDLMFSNEEFAAAVVHYGDLLNQAQLATDGLVSSN